jgi:hypothetical protein
MVHVFTGVGKILIYLDYSSKWKIKTVSKWKKTLKLHCFPPPF